ncbi:MAG: arsinothricin resistance N-acetyltransferase ArsN1 family B [Vulcanimicrobiaceae bacterium]
MIRVATPQDAAAFAEIYAPYVTGSLVSFEEEAPSPQEMERRVRATLTYAPWLAASIADRIAGYAYASHHRERPGYRWAVDVSVYVRPEFQRRGIGRTLYQELFIILERQRYRRAYAGIALPNDASVALHRAVGFEEVGVYRRVGWKMGRWLDVVWLERNIGPDRDDAVTPSEPIPFAELCARYSSPLPATHT